MRWFRRHDQPEPAPDETDENAVDVDEKVKDAGRQLAESRARAARARKIAEESARLVAANSITSLIRDSIIGPDSS